MSRFDFNADGTIYDSDDKRWLELSEFLVLAEDLSVEVDDLTDQLSDVKNERDELQDQVCTLEGVLEDVTVEM
jgi:hypothetical protein